MPKTLTPNNTFPTQIENFPISGANEPVAIEPLESAIQAVLDRTENLHQSRLTVEGVGVKRIRRVATIADLANLAGMSDGDTVDVDGLGRYRLDTTSNTPADGLWVVSAAGGGRWIHLLNSMRGRTDGLATLDGAGRLQQDVRDGSVGTAQLANSAVTSAKLAAAAVGTGQLADGAVTPSKLGLKDPYNNYVIGNFRLQDGGFKSFAVNMEWRGDRWAYIGSNAPTGVLHFTTTATAQLVVPPLGTGGDTVPWVVALEASAAGIRSTALAVGGDYGELASYGLGVGQLLTKNGAFIDARHSYKAPPTISLAIGDHDTGLNWGGDGFVELWGNSALVGKWSGFGVEFHKPVEIRAGSLGDYLRLINSNNTNKFWRIADNGNGQIVDIFYAENGVNHFIWRFSAETVGSSVPIHPEFDNSISLGASWARWSAVYAANGTIQTSDAREKTDIQDEPLGLEFIEKLRPVAYRWRVGGYDLGEPIIEEQHIEDGVGDEGNPKYRVEKYAKPNPIPRPGKRLHHGLIAQDVKRVLDEFGIDFGGWVQDDINDPDSRQSLRYDQFIAPLIRAVQELSARVKELEARLGGTHGRDN